MAESTVSQYEEKTTNHENLDNPVHPVIPESQIKVGNVEIINSCKVEAMTPTVASPLPRPVFEPASAIDVPPSSNTIGKGRDKIKVCLHHIYALIFFRKKRYLLLK